MSFRETANSKLKVSTQVITAELRTVSKTCLPILKNVIYRKEGHEGY